MAMLKLEVTQSAGWRCHCSDFLVADSAKRSQENDTRCASFRPVCLQDFRYEVELCAKAPCAVITFDTMVDFGAIAHLLHCQSRPIDGASSNDARLRSPSGFINEKSYCHLSRVGICFITFQNCDVSLAKTCTPSCYVQEK